MSLMKKIKLKKKIVKAVDDYLRQLVDSKDITGVRIDLNNDELMFEQIKFDKVVKFRISIRDVYAECADLDDETEVQDKVDDYISRLYYQEYVEQREQG